MRRTHRIFDKKYEKDDLSQIVSNSKNLTNNKQIILRDVLNKYEFIFDGTLVTQKKKPVDIKLQPVAKPYHDKPYLVPQAHKAVFRKEVEQLC